MRAEIEAGTFIFHLVRADHRQPQVSPRLLEGARERVNAMIRLRLGIHHGCVLLLGGDASNHRNYSGFRSKIGV